MFIYIFDIKNSTNDLLKEVRITLVAAICKKQESHNLFTAPETHLCHIFHSDSSNVFVNVNSFSVRILSNLSVTLT